MLRHQLNISCRFATVVVIALVSIGILNGCRPSSRTSEVDSTSRPGIGNTGALDNADAGTAQQTTLLSLPKDFGRFTGDWDEILRRGTLRVLVIYSKSGFFYDKGRPRGISAEAMEEFENITNAKLMPSGRRIKVVFLPVTPGQLQKSLEEGLGDLICTGVIVTPEREELMDFTIPTANNVKLVIVTNRAGAAVNSVDDLSGKDVFINPTSVAKADFERLNQRFKETGKPSVNIVEVDRNLTEDDLLEMTNAGLISATVAFDFRAELWSKIYTDIVVDSPVVLREGGDIAWAVRKGSPQLKEVLDDFIKTHRPGTSFGNTIVRRYLQSTTFLKNSTSAAEIKKFEAYVKYFQQYGSQYNFDYLMLAAQGYQESMLQQERVSPRGAVGIMQVLPRYAAAKPINISNVRGAQDNIHAGTKMLAFIAKTYFNDPGIDQKNKTLFTFAAYNAGASRIVRLRKETQQQGLDPNLWFGNVELLAGKDIGQETVTYVSNIYKYYVAYSMVVDQEQARERAKKSLEGK